MTCLMLALVVAAPPGAEDVRTLYEQGQLTAVIARGRAILAEDPTDRVAHHYVGRALVDLDYNLETRAAIEHLEASLRGLPPDDRMLAWAHVYIARAYYMGGQRQRAIDRYELVLALDVDPACSAAATAALGELGRDALAPQVAEIARLYDGGRYDAAIRMGEGLLARDPRGGTVARILDPLFYHYLGRAYVDLDDRRHLDTAITHLRRALDLADERRWITGWTHLYLGLACEALGRLDAARVHFDQALAIAIDDECTARARFRLLHLGQDPYAAWDEYTSAYVVLHIPPDTDLARHPGPFARTLDHACSVMSRVIAVDPAQRIDVYVYRNADHGRHLLGRDLGWCDRTRQAVHIDAEMNAAPALAACLSHRIARQPYCDSVVLRTGLAEALGGDADEPHADAVAALKAGALPSVTELERSFHAREHAAALAGSFVRFLLETYSNDQFLAMWRDAGNGQYDLAFKRHYQQSADQLSESWKLYLQGQD